MDNDINLLPHSIFLMTTEMATGGTDPQTGSSAGKWPTAKVLVYDIPDYTACDQAKSSPEAMAEAQKLETEIRIKLATHLGVKPGNLTIVSKEPEDGTVVYLLDNDPECQDVQAVEIDRTQPTKGLEGLQEARQSGQLNVRVLVYSLMHQRYSDIEPDADISEPIPSRQRICV